MRGLVDNEKEFEEALVEAIAFKLGGAVRQFFVLLATNEAPVKVLWEKYRDSISEDIMYRLEQMSKESTSDNREKAYDLALMLDVMFGGKCIVFAGDRRQIPPIVVGGTAQDAVKASFYQSL